MKYGDLIGSVLYLISALIWWIMAYRLFKVQRRHIEEQERIIARQNQRMVGFLAVFEMLLRKMNEKV